jgi:hypothetical protein
MLSRRCFNLIPSVERVLKGAEPTMFVTLLSQ